MPHIDRRAFIASTLATVAAGCTTTRWVEATKPTQNVLEISTSSLDESGQVIVEHASLQAPILVRRMPDGGHLGLRMLCTHNGCAVRVQRDRIVCPCHGSRFGQRGEVLQGPAEAPLARYVVEVRGDTLRIQLTPSDHNKGTRS